MKLRSWLAAPVLVISAVALMCFLFAYEYALEHHLAPYMGMPPIVAAALGTLAGFGAYLGNPNSSRRRLRAALVGLITSLLVLPLLAATLWLLYGSM